MVNSIQSIRFVLSLAAALALTSAFAATRADLDKAMSHDGLQKITVKGIDLAYARPGASLASYDHVKLDPIDVAFRKDWNPTRPGSRIKVSSEERENIRSGVAKLAYEEFVKELQNDSVYKIRDSAGPNVLRVKIQILNLYPTASAGATTAVSRNYTVSPAEMTLFAELYDSETGKVLARVADRSDARQTHELSVTNRAMNIDEARTTASDWARILRNALDKAHGIGTK
jgi:Protein of unknown function (DUF3313)